MKLIITLLIIMLSINTVHPREVFQPNDSEYSLYQAHFLKLMDYEAAYKRGLHGEGVKVAIIDSGIVLHHDLAKDNILKGYNFVSDNSQDIADRTGHGTFIAGIIGAKSNNNKGIVGLTPMVHILPIKCFDRRLTTDIQVVIMAVEKAIEEKVDVINLSLCTAIKSRELEKAINRAVEKGIIVVAPSGNDNSGEKRYPASYQQVVSVNAIHVNPVGLEVKPSRMSNPNNAVTVSAPGDNILSLSFTDLDGYKQRDGSSYATAYVTSLAIAIKQFKPSITAQEFIELLEETSTDFGEEGYDPIYGHGIINFKAILNQLIKER